MKKNPFYLLRTVGGVPRLLPFGQAVAAMRPGVELNESAARLWALLDDCPDRAALERAFGAASGGADVRGDLDAFFSALTGLGILLPEEPLAAEAARAPLFADLRVGPLRVRLRGGADLFHDDFAPFLSPADADAAPAQTLAFVTAPAPEAAGMTCLLESGELAVFRAEARFLLRFPTMPGIAGALLSADGAAGVFCLRPEADAARLRADLFHAIRHAALFRAQCCGFFAMHAVSVLYRERVWLFSAVSGTGKSTHARLWETLFGAPQLNGDLALLSLGRGGAVFHPLPWCGTSGVAREETHPLGGVAFLRRAEENAAVPLPARERALRCANRLISPVWTAEQAEENLRFSELLARAVPMWELRCTPDGAAAEEMRRAIDAAAEEVRADG